MRLFNANANNKANTNTKANEWYRYYYPRQWWRWWKGKGGC